MCHALIGAYVHALRVHVVVCCSVFGCTYALYYGEECGERLCGWWVKEVGNVQEWQGFVVKVRRGRPV